MNKNYNEIKNLGFDVELRNNAEGWSVAYLLRDGVRTNKTQFYRSNNQNARKQTPTNACKGSHLDIALINLVNTIKRAKCHRGEANH